MVEPDQKSLNLSRARLQQRYTAEMSSVISETYRDWSEIEVADKADGQSADE